MIPKESLELFAFGVFGLVGWDLLNEISALFGIGFIIVMSTVAIVGLISSQKKSERSKRKESS